MAEQENSENPDFIRQRLYEETADRELLAASVIVASNTYLYGFSKGLARGVLVTGTAFTAFGVEQMAVEGDYKFGAVCTTLGLAKIAMSAVVSRITVPVLEERTR